MDWLNVRLIGSRKILYLFTNYFLWLFFWTSLSSQHLILALTFCTTIEAQWSRFNWITTFSLFAIQNLITILERTKVGSNWLKDLKSISFLLDIEHLLIKVYFTSHLKQSGCQSLSNAVRRWAVVSPSFGAIGWLHLQHLGANFL